MRESLNTIIVKIAYLSTFDSIQFFWSVYGKHIHFQKSFIFSRKISDTSTLYERWIIEITVKTRETFGLSPWRQMELKNNSFWCR